MTHVQEHIIAESQLLERYRLDQHKAPHLHTKWVEFVREGAEDAYIWMEFNHYWPRMLIQFDLIQVTRGHTSWMHKIEDKVGAMTQREMHKAMFSFGHVTNVLLMVEIPSIFKPTCWEGKVA